MPAASRLRCADPPNCPRRLAPPQWPHPGVCQGFELRLWAGLHQGAELGLLLAQRIGDVDGFIVQRLGARPVARHGQPVGEAVDRDHAFRAEQPRALDRELPDRSAAPHGDDVTGLDAAGFGRHEPGREDVGQEEHLLVGEFVGALACLSFTFFFSIFVNAQLLQQANINKTPNPSKAPWYFMGLQELLTMFHPMVAGVTIPGMGLVIMIIAAYTDKNPSNKPEDRKFATSIWTVHLMFWAVLVIISSFFRGPGFNFVFPWRDGIFFEL